jgi:hypothetical protein
VFRRFLSQKKKSCIGLLYNKNMGTIKTLVNNASVEDFINSIDGDVKKADSFRILEMYKAATGEKPKMWGSSIIGFGQYHYKSERSSQEGDWPLAGFSPRKQNLTLYVMSELNDYTDLLSKLGKHKTSKACLYINKLSDVNEVILKQLIRRSYDDAKKALVDKK